MGNARVAVPPDWNPNEGGGPLRRGPGSNVVQAHAGNYVYRSPNTNTREAEPGAGWPGGLSHMMFLPDGRLVPATPIVDNMFHGAGDPSVTGRFKVKLKSSVGASVTAMVGAGFGLVLAPPDRRVASTVIGAVAGGILGLIFG